MSFPLQPGDPSQQDFPLHRIDDHDERALALLLEQFKRKPRLEALIRILAEPFQELENVFWDLLVLRRLSTATAAQLDIIGDIVDEPRGPLNDTDYRAVIRMKILVLKSAGAAETIMTLTRLVIGNDAFQYHEFFPAAEVIELQDSPTFTGTLLAKFLRKAKSGGVRLDLWVPGPSGFVLFYTSVTSGGGSNAYSGVTAGGDQGDYAGVI